MDLEMWTCREINKVKMDKQPLLQKYIFHLLTCLFLHLYNHSCLCLFLSFIEAALRDYTEELLVSHSSQRFTMIHKTKNIYKKIQLQFKGKKDFSLKQD